MPDQEDRSEKRLPLKPVVSSDEIDHETDPWQQSRAAFIQAWLGEDADLSTTAREYLLEIVRTENGPWNDVENVIEVFEYPDEPGVVYICHCVEGEELEVPFRYQEGSE